MRASIIAVALLVVGGTSALSQDRTALADFAECLGEGDAAQDIVDCAAPVHERCKDDDGLFFDALCLSAARADLSGALDEAVDRFEASYLADNPDGYDTARIAALLVWKDRRMGAIDCEFHERLAIRRAPAEEDFLSPEVNGRLAMCLHAVELSALRTFSHFIGEEHADSL
ncbi:MAG: hypothetical protein AAFN79_10465 [Pseudomonadota bacterium]